MTGKSSLASVDARNRLQTGVCFSTDSVARVALMLPFSRCHRSRRPGVTFNRDALRGTDRGGFPVPSGKNYAGVGRESTPHGINALCVRRRQENVRGLVGWCLLSTDVRVEEYRGRDDLYFPVRGGAEKVAPAFQYFPVRGGAG